MTFFPFRTPIGCFLYDRGEDAILPIDEDEYEEFIHAVANYDDKHPIILRYNQHGLCLKNPIEHIEHPVSANVEALLESSVENIVLQVTQNCNLRCEYCSYSALYHNRPFSNKKMSFAIARDSVDFAITHSSECEKLTIGFFGGEPLLEFEIIKQVISYVEDTYPDKAITYNMTTNGTLLSNEIVAFLAQKNIEVMVSIDGPKDEHDKHRRFITGEGSYDTIMENLKQIKANYPDYYTKISTNTVISPGHEYICVRDFFNTDELINLLNHSISRITDVNLVEPVIYDEALLIMDREEKCKVMLNMIGEIDDSMTSSIYSSFKAYIIGKYAGMKLKGVKHKSAHPGGPCIPGVRKSFVDVDGYIFPCEKITEDKAFSIGSIYDGFDIKKILIMLNIGNLTEEECMNCWAFKRCSICVAQITENRRISKEAKKRCCPDVLIEVESTLKDYAILKYYGFDFEKSITPLEG